MVVKRRPCIWLLGLLFLVSCAKSNPVPPAKSTLPAPANNAQAPAESTAPTPPSPAQTAASNTDSLDPRDLFPAADTQLVYRFQDRSESRELLLVADNRIIQSVGTEPYVTWFFTQQGVLRPDGSDPDRKKLIRYLPPKLQDGVIWQQYGLGESYEFRLTRIPTCLGDGLQANRCWQLEVVTSQGVTTFQFAYGVGVMRAEADLIDATEAFDKRLVSNTKAQVASQERAGLLDKGAALEQMKPFGDRDVQTWNVSSFPESLQRQKEQPRCGRPADGQPLLPGAAGSVSFLCGRKLWSLDLATGKQSVLLTPDAPLTGFAWEPKGRGLALAGRAGTASQVLYWDAASGQTRSLASDLDGAVTLSWSPDGGVLIASPGTSKEREYLFFDRASRAQLGSTGGIGMVVSGPPYRYATERAVDIPEKATSPGASRTLEVGTLPGGKATEQQAARGDSRAGYRPLFFAGDGTLVYEQFDPVGGKRTALWSLAPGAAPVRLDDGAPLAVEARSRLESAPQMIAGRKVHVLGASPDGKWTLFIYDSYAEVYLVSSSLQGPVVRLPGSSHQWDPRPPA